VLRGDGRSAGLPCRQDGARRRRYSFRCPAPSTSFLEAIKEGQPDLVVPCDPCGTLRIQANHPLKSTQRGCKADNLEVVVSNSPMKASYPRKERTSELRRSVLLRQLEHLTKSSAKEFNVGLMKHGFMVSRNEHDLNAIIHNLFPAQGFVDTGKLGDIGGTK
jgi:hypothetical protein